MDVLMVRAQTPSWVSRIKLGSRAPSAAPSHPTSSTRAATPLRPSSGPIGPQRNRPTRPFSAPWGGGVQGDAKGVVDPTMKSPTKGAGPPRPAAASATPMAATPVQIITKDQMNLSVTNSSADPNERHWTLDPHAAEDQFSQREKEIVRELNKVRGDPRGASVSIRSSAVVEPPYVDKPYSIDDATKFILDMKKDLVVLDEEIALGKDGLTREVAALKASWQIQDETKPKGGAKPSSATKKPAGKAGGGASTVEAEGATSEAEAREQQLKSLEESHKNRMSAAVQKSVRLKEDVARAQLGIDRFVALLKALGAFTHALPNVRFSRGLSLAAWDRCVELEGMLAQASTVCEVDKRFGTCVGAAHALCCVGAKSASEVVVSMLLDSNYQKILLSPSVTKVGCGWRRHPVHKAVTILTAAEGFQESLHVKSTKHMSLQAVRRLCEGVAPQQPHEITFSTDKVMPVHPKFHPVPCGNDVSIALTCPSHLYIAAILSTDLPKADAKPQTTTECFGNTCYDYRHSKMNVSFFPLHPPFPQNFFRVQKMVFQGPFSERSV